MRYMVQVRRDAWSSRFVFVEANNANAAGTKALGEAPGLVFPENGEEYSVEFCTLLNQEEG